MLHSGLRGRQVPGWLLSVLLVAACALLVPGGADAARSDDLAAADAFARSGQHGEAAALYESLAKRFFRGWDTRLALLSAREYQLAGSLDDAERMLGVAGTPERADDVVLHARVTAEVALARGRPTTALQALARVPEPWPAPLAVELLGLRARAEFDSGRILDSIRTTEARARLLSGPDERRANYARLVDALVANPAASAFVPANASPSERAWLELGQLLGGAADPDAVAQARRVADWRERYPNHPGAQFLPEAPAPGELAQAAVHELATGSGSVALLLPLSGRQQAAGVAVRDGFLAAVLAESVERRPRIDVYDTAAGAAAAYQRALASGARAVVGPLIKDDVTAIVRAGPLPVPTIALNSVTGAAPAFLFQFSLDPEQEAREAARRIAHDGHVRGIALFPRNAWGERVEAAFVDELRLTAVELMSEQYYDTTGSDFSGPLRAALGRYGGAGERDAKGDLRERDGTVEALTGPQFAFIAASPQAARALRPQLRFQMAYEIAVYATSDAWDTGSRAAPDLEGLQLPQMPWLLHDGDTAPALWGALQRDWAVEGRGRLQLYAFGFDAYRLLRGLDLAARGVAVDGLTGRLTVAPDGRVLRETEWAQVRDGLLQPAGMIVPPPLPGET